MNLEDELRATMRDHDADAPDSLRFAPRRRRVWLPAVAAAAVVVAVAGVLLAVRGDDDHRPEQSSRPSTSTASRPLAAPVCPTSYRLDGNDSAGWVPRRPQADVAANQLVPAAAPGGAVVCSFRRAYPQPRKPRLLPLAMTRSIRRGLAAVPKVLRDAPREGGLMCTSDLRPTDFEHYLIGLRYDDGVVWLAAPGDHCAGTTNGAFAARLGLRAYAKSALVSGEFAATVQPDESAETEHECLSQGAGRLGDDRALVPGSPVRAEICTATPDSTRLRAVTVTGYDLAGLVRDLNALRTEHAVGCRIVDGGGEETYEITFEYPTGPVAGVTVNPGCRPEIANPSLFATATPELLARVRGLAGD